MPHPDQRQPLLPDAFALALMRACPRRAEPGHFVRDDGLHRRFARVSLDEQSNHALQTDRLRVDFLHQFVRIRTRICPHQHRRGHQNGGHWQGALEFVWALRCRVLHTRAQCLFQSIAQADQVHRQRATTIHAGVRAPEQFLFGTTVVHVKNIKIHVRLAKWQRPRSRWVVH